MKFRHFSPSLENFFGYPWKNPLFASTAKNPSDVHECSFLFHNRVDDIRAILPLVFVSAFVFVISVRFLSREVRLAFAF